MSTTSTSLLRIVTRAVAALALGLLVVTLVALIAGGTFGFGFFEIAALFVLILGFFAALKWRDARSSGLGGA